MSREWEAEVRERKWSSGDSRAPDLDGECAEGTSSLSVFLVRRLASHEKCSKNQERSQM